LALCVLTNILLISICSPSASVHLTFSYRQAYVVLVDVTKIKVFGDPSVNRPDIIGRSAWVKRNPLLSRAQQRPSEKPLIEGHVTVSGELLIARERQYGFRGS